MTGSPFYNDQLEKFLVFASGGAVFIMVAMLVARWIRPSRPDPEKLLTYESGEEPITSAWPMYNSRFYMVAIVFLLFDIELVFLFPWVTVFADEDLLRETDGWWGWFSFVEMMTFIGLLVLGLVYAWARGLLEWVRPKPQLPEYQSPVPRERYEEINRKFAPGK